MDKPGNSLREAELRRSLDINGLLVKRLLDGSDLDGMTATLAEFMNCCVLISDAGTSFLSIGFAGGITVSLKDAIRTFLSKADVINAKNSAYSIRAASPVLTSDEQDGLTFNRLICGIRSDNDFLGYLSVIRANVPFTDEDQSVILNAVGLMAVRLSQDKKIAEIELRLKGNFIEDLISTHYSDPESIMNRARALAYNISLPHRVLVAEIENLKHLLSKRSDASESPNLKIELVKSIQNRLNQVAGGMVSHHNDEIILLVPLKAVSAPVSRIKTLSQSIIDFVADQFGAKMYIGIGNVCSELSDFSKSYLSAKKSLEIGTYMITEGQVRSFEQFSVHALFMSTIKPAELYNYARNLLGGLLTYDEEHHTDFIKTLQEFLYLRNNVEKTARTINMSVSGLKYRLKKIEKIIGRDLQDYKVSFDLQLALIILQLFGEYRIRKS